MTQRRFRSLQPAIHSASPEAVLACVRSGWVKLKRRISPQSTPPARNVPEDSLTLIQASLSHEGEKGISMYSSDYRGSHYFLFAISG